MTTEQKSAEHGEPEVRVIYQWPTHDAFGVIRACLIEVDGVSLADVRVWRRGPEGVLLPSLDGLSIPRQHLSQLLSAVIALQGAN